MCDMWFRVVVFYVCNNSIGGKEYEYGCQENAYRYCQ